MSKFFRIKLSKISFFAVGLFFLGTSQAFASESAYAILGFKIGDSFASVESGLSEKHKISRWTGKLRYDGAETFDAKIQGVGKVGRTQFSSLFSSPPETDKLVRAARRVDYKRDTGPLVATLKQQLISLYGEPNYIQDHRLYTLIIWSKSPEGKALSRQEAKACETRSVLDMIQLNYRINMPAYCGETLRVNISKVSSNPSIISNYSASLYNEAYKRTLDSKTNAFSSEKKRIQLEEQTSAARDRRADF